MRIIIHYSVLIGLFLALSSCTRNTPPDTIRKGNLVYDFSFVNSAIRFIETGDSSILVTIAQSEAAQHLLNHAKQFNYDVPKNSTLDLVKYLLKDANKNKDILPEVKRNLQYAIDSVAETDLPQKECRKYLPEGFPYNSKLFFTFGYDLGVVYKNNASVNLANDHYLKNYREIRYYSIHELHHAGLVTLKNNQMPDLNVHTYADMTALIEYCTQLEGMGTFVPYQIREKESALTGDNDYIALSDSAMMRQYELEYFQIYSAFKDNPQNPVTTDDWERISSLSDGKRLWYRVGAYMAMKIDQKLGRKKLIDLISQPPAEFIATYQSIRQQ